MKNQKSEYKKADQYNEVTMWSRSKTKEENPEKGYLGSISKEKTTIRR